METYTHPQFPVHLSVVHVALYTAVANSSLLRARIIKAATTQGAEGDCERDTINFAFVDARLVSQAVLNFQHQYSKDLQ
jgi:EKC/KEOPS complex subunit CGI121/TPRKB